MIHRASLVLQGTCNCFILIPTSGSWCVVAPGAYRWDASSSRWTQLVVYGAMSPQASANTNAHYSVESIAGTHLTQLFIQQELAMPACMGSLAHGSACRLLAHSDASQRRPPASGCGCFDQPQHGSERLLASAKYGSGQLLHHPQPSLGRGRQRYGTCHTKAKVTGLPVKRW